MYRAVEVGASPPSVSAKPSSKRHFFRRKESESHTNSLVRMKSGHASNVDIPRRGNCCCPSRLSPALRVHSNGIRGTTATAEPSSPSPPAQHPATPRHHSNGIRAGLASESQGRRHDVASCKLLGPEGSSNSAATLTLGAHGSRPPGGASKLGVASLSNGMSHGVLPEASSQRECLESPAASETQSQTRSE